MPPKCPNSCGVRLGISIQSGTMKRSSKIYYDPFGQLNYLEHSILNRSSFTGRLNCILSNSVGPVAKCMQDYTAFFPDFR